MLWQMLWHRDSCWHRSRVKDAIAGWSGGRRYRYQLTGAHRHADALRKLLVRRTSGWVTIDDPAQPASSSLGSLQAMMQSLSVSKRPRKGRQDSGRTSQSDWLAKINVGLITSRDTIINRKACFHCIARATLDNVQTRTYAVSWCSVDALTSAASLRMDLSAAHPQIDTLFESLSFWLIINKPIK
jgi:hypothetical protein